MSRPELNGANLRKAGFSLLDSRIHRGFSVRDPAGRYYRLDDRLMVGASYYLGNEIVTALESGQ